MTIKAEIRDKVIHMSQVEKKGRNHIAHELGIGQGTVSNILKEWRAGETPPATTIPTSEGSVCIEQPEAATITIQTDMNKVGSPQGLAVPLNPNYNVSSPKPRNGNPLSQLIIEDKDNLEIKPNPLQIKANIHNEKKCFHNQYETIKEKKQYQRRASLSDFKNTSRRSENNRGKGEEDQDQEEYIDLDIDWDSLPPRLTSNFSSLEGSDFRMDESPERNFLTRILQEKQVRQQEMEWIITEQQENAQAQKWIDEQNRNLKSREANLKIREAKVAEIEHLAPSLRQLQEMGVTFEMIQNYIWLVNERSVSGNIDIRQAALFLLSEFRELKNLGGIFKKKQEARKELKELNMLITQKQREVTTFSGGNGNNNNGYALSDYNYIRLNLLKQNNNNMLNRMVQ